MHQVGGELDRAVSWPAVAQVVNILVLERKALKVRWIWRVADESRATIAWQRQELLGIERSLEIGSSARIDVNHPEDEDLLAILRW
jgi:hypothetical protein